MTGVERQARNAAFDELMAEINPAFALKREMVTARRRAGISQRELARRMKTSQSVIGFLEQGRRTPNIATLRKLADATGSRLVVRLDSLKAAG
jgi:ribosome-binding protein aMBF1 (putative translation factor)